VVGIDDGVPDGVELVSRVVVLKEEVITSSVSAWLVLGVPVSVVEWLMHITVEMNEETKGLGFTLILRFGVLHNGGVGEGASVRLTIEPVVKLRHNGGDVLEFDLDIKLVVRRVVTKDCLVIEMPRRLPSTSNSLDIIWPCNALNEWVILLMLLCRVVAEFGQNIFSLLQSRWIFSLEDLISLSSGHEMRLTVPGDDLRHLK